MYFSQTFKNHVKTIKTTRGQARYWHRRTAGVDTASSYENPGVFVTQEMIQIKEVTDFDNGPSLPKQRHGDYFLNDTSYGGADTKIDVPFSTGKKV